MFQLLIKMIDTSMFRAKSKQVLDRMKTAVDAYYQATGPAKFNKTIMEAAGWGLIVAIAIVSISVFIAFPPAVGLAATILLAGSAFAWTTAYLKDTQYYFSFAAEKKAEISVITKAILLSDDIQQLKTKFASIRKPNGKDESIRYGLLKKMLKDLEELGPDKFTDKLDSDAASASTYVEKAWTLSQLFSEECEKGDFAIMDMFDQNYPDRKEIENIVKNIKPEQQLYLIEGHFDHKSPLCQECGLDEVTLQRLEKAFKYREEKPLQAIWSYLKYLTFGVEEKRDADTTFMMKELQFGTGNIQDFLSNTLTKRQERILSQDKIDDLRREIADTREAAVTRAVDLHSNKDDNSKMTRVMKSYLYDQIKECDRLVKKLDGEERNPTKLKEITGEVSKVTENVELREVPREYLNELEEDTLREKKQENYIKQKRAISTAIDGIQQTPVPPNIKQACAVLLGAFSKDSSEDCKEVLETSNLYKEFTLDGGRVHKKLKDTYCEKLNSKWEEFCHRLQKVNPESDGDLGREIEGVIKQFTEVYQYVKDNEGMWGAKVIIRKKDDIKSGIEAKIPAALSRFERNMEMTDIKMGNIEVKVRYTDADLEALQKNMDKSNPENKKRQLDQNVVVDKVTVIAHEVTVKKAANKTEMTPKIK